MVVVAMMRKTGLGCTLATYCLYAVEHLFFPTVYHLTSKPTIPRVSPLCSMLSIVQTLPRLCTLTIHGELHVPAGGEGLAVDESLETAMADGLPKLGM